MFRCGFLPFQRKAAGLVRRIRTQEMVLERDISGHALHHGLQNCVVIAGTGKTGTGRKEHGQVFDHRRLSSRPVLLTSRQENHQGKKPYSDFLSHNFGIDWYNVKNNKSPGNMPGPKIYAESRTDGKNLRRINYCPHSLGDWPVIVVNVRLKTEGEEKPQLEETSAIFISGCSVIRRLASSTR